MKVSLTDICDFQGGTQPPKDEWIDQPAQGYVRMLQIRDFTQSDKNYIEYVKDTGKLKTCIEDDILIGRYGASIGKILTGLAGAYNVAIVKTIPDEKVVSKKYLYWYLNSQYFQRFISNVGSRAAQAGFNKNDLGAAQIPLVDKERQEEICEVLEKANKLISLRKQQLAKLDEVVKARFVEMFGDLAAPQCEYPELKLVDICADADDIKCGPFGTQLNKDEYKIKGVAVWEIPQINSGFSEMPTHFITEEKAVILNAYSIEPGDIAMSRKGNVGKCGLFPENLKKGIIHSDVLRIRVDKRKVDSCFMMYQLHFSEAVKRQIEMVSSGAIMAGINVTKLKQIKVRIPELENQRMFAAFVERVDQQKQTVQQSLEKLELMKKALMQEYFG